MRLVSDRLRSEECGFVTPEVFHIRLVIDIQLRGSYIKTSRRLGIHISESRARGDITFECGLN